MSEARRSRRGPVSLGRTLTVSVALHAILLVLLWLLPTAPPAPRAEEIAVRFDLEPETPPPEIPVPEDSELFRPTGPVDDREVDEPVQPAPSSLGSLVPDPAPPSPEPTPRSPSVDGTNEPETAEDRERRDEAVETREEPDPADAREAEESRGLDLPGDRSELRQGNRPAPEPLDLGRAIRDYVPSPSTVAPPEQPEPPGTREGMELPDLERLPASGFGMDRNLMFESSDYDWSEYTRQIYMAIWRAWHSRLWQTTEAFERWGWENRTDDLAHQVLIQFTIHRSGEVTDIFVVTPSACGPLDASATDAMAEVILPRLPEDFPRDEERVRGRFIARGGIRDMKRTLAWLRQAGWF